MIWLSSTTENTERTFYFDIRDVSLRRNGRQTEGLVRGLLGDGECELWAEAVLGQESRLQILPIWTEQGTVEGFTPQIDEADLKAQLLDALERIFSGFARLTLPEPCQYGFHSRQANGVKYPASLELAS